MDVVAERGEGVDRVDDIFGEIARVRSGEAHAADAGDLADSREQFGKRHLARRIAVGVHVLAEQLNLGEASIGHALGFGQDGGGGARTLLAAGVGDDAVGAEFVATLDDGDVSAMWVRPRGEFRVEGLFCLAVVEAGNAAFARFQPHQHLGQIAVGSRAADQRDVGRAVEDFFALLLGDAAEHGELLAFALQALVFIQPVEDFLFGLVADGAGVIEDQSGVGLVLDAQVAFVLQCADDFLRVMGVHLAAKRLDIESLRHD